MKPVVPSPIVQLRHQDFEKKEVEVFVKREDLIHSEIMGNKWRKLKYNLEEAKRQGLKIWAHAVIPPVRPSEVVDAGVEVVSHAGNIVKSELVETLKSRYDFGSFKAAMNYKQYLNSFYLILNDCRDP